MPPDPSRLRAPKLPFFLLSKVGKYVYGIPPSPGQPRPRLTTPKYQLPYQIPRSAAFESTRPNTNSHPSQPAPHWSTRTPVPRPTRTYARLPRLVPAPGASAGQCWCRCQTRAWLKSHSPKLSDSLHGRGLFLICPNPLLKAIPIKYIVQRLKLCSFFV